MIFAVMERKNLANQFFTEKKWEWVAERYREGYTQKMLAEFLGINRYTIQRHFQKMGVIPYALDELDPLSERKKEFIELGEEK